MAKDDSPVLRKHSQNDGSQKHANHKEYGKDNSSRKKSSFLLNEQSESEVDFSIDAP